MKKKYVAILIVVLILVLAGCGESFSRSVKTFRSEYSGGLNRSVKVYSNSGDLLESYEGRLDIEANEYGNKVLFDVDGKRVIIYNATVIVEEL